LFIVARSAPVSRANTRSFTANGLCDLIAAMSPIFRPARSSARRAAGTGASGMCARATRAWPNATTRIAISGRAESSRASTLVVTTIAALPSAGWVCAP
jgi:hypothetical protein